jgi:acyl CoA:acetate/3-ketoacid CoA transferase alpha subunit
VGAWLGRAAAMADKRKSMAEIVRTIPDGAHIALGGFAIARNVIVAVHELIRQGKKNLTVSQGVAGLDTDLLVGAGCVSRLIIGGGSLDRFGPVHCINKARETKSLQSEDYTSLSLSFRYLAGALGLSFIPIKSLISSEILERLEGGKGAGDVHRTKCPFTGEDYLLLRALNPDVSFVHVQTADAEGNCRIDGPRWENEEQAKAGERIIVIAEEIVSTDEFRREPERTIIPAHRVEAVVHQPFGAHPTAVYGRYDYDAEHLKLYVRHSKNGGAIGAYLDEYVRGTNDHADYLAKIGGAALDALKADPALGY